MKDKNESCVELNIYVECDKCSKSEPIVSCPDDKHDDNESCVKINVFVECDDKKHRYTVWCYNLKWPPIFRRSFLSFINTKNYWFIKMRLNISWVNPYFSKKQLSKNNLAAQSLYGIVFQNIRMHISSSQAQYAVFLYYITFITFLFHCLLFCIFKVIIRDMRHIFYKITTMYLIVILYT